MTEIERLINNGMALRNIMTPTRYGRMTTDVVSRLSFISKSLVTPPLVTLITVGAILFALLSRSASLVRPNSMDRYFPFEFSGIFTAEGLRTWTTKIVSWKATNLNKTKLLNQVLEKRLKNCFIFGILIFCNTVGIWNRTI